MMMTGNIKQAKHSALSAGPYLSQQSMLIRLRPPSVELFMSQLASSSFFSHSSRPFFSSLSRRVSAFFSQPCSTTSCASTGLLLLLLRVQWKAVPLYSSFYFQTNVMSFCFANFYFITWLIYLSRRITLSHLLCWHEGNVFSVFTEQQHTPPERY